MKRQMYVFVWTSAPHEINKGPAKSIPVWLKGGSSETHIYQVDLVVLQQHRAIPHNGDISNTYVSQLACPLRSSTVLLKW